MGTLVDVAAIPAARGGAARYNVRNAMTAAGLAHALGIGDGAIARGLAGFASTPETNPGRGNVFAVGGATALVDFAHNAHGVQALAETVGGAPAERRLVLLSQPGDRTDREIRAFASALGALGADRYVVTELPGYLRGREPGVTPALLREALLASGAAPEAIREAADPAAGVREALAWAAPGDLLLLLVLSHRDAALEAVARRETAGVAGEGCDGGMRPLAPEAALRQAARATRDLWRRSAVGRLWSPRPLAAVRRRPSAVPSRQRLVQCS